MLVGVGFGKKRHMFSIGSICAYTVGLMIHHECKGRWGEDYDNISGSAFRKSIAAFFTERIGSIENLFVSCPRRRCSGG